MTNKYNSKKVTIDGIEFDSKIEARYYEHLKELEKQGVVSEFLLQKKYLLLEGFDKNGKRIRPIHYIADFEVHYADGTIEVVDIKGFETPDFRIKKKLFEYRYPFELKLITYSKIDGGWIELEDLKKARRERKKQRQK